MTKRKDPTRIKLATVKPRIAMLDTTRVRVLPARLAAAGRRDRAAIYQSRRWREHVRPLKLRLDPCCQRCSHVGIVRQAEHVDHWEPLARGGDPWRISGLVSLCRPCHTEKTAMEQRGETAYFAISPSRAFEPGIA